MVAVNVHVRIKKTQRGGKPQGRDSVMRTVVDAVRRLPAGRAFSECEERSRQNRLTLLHDCASCLSGGDPEETQALFAGFMESADGGGGPRTPYRECATNLMRDVIATAAKKYNDLIARVAEAYVRVKNLEIKRALVWVVSGIGWQRLRELGFDGLGWRMLSTVREGGPDPELGQAGHPTLSVHQIDLIHNTFYEFSQPATAFAPSLAEGFHDDLAKCCGCLGFLGEPTHRVLTKPVTEIALIIEQRYKISRSAALNHMPKGLVKPRKVTDYCVHCASLRRTLAKQKPFASQNEFG